MSDRPVRIAQITCGAEYSGIQNEITSAAATVGAQMFYPDVALKDVTLVYTDEFNGVDESNALTTRKTTVGEFLAEMREETIKQQILKHFDIRYSEVTAILKCKEKDQTIDWIVER